LTFVFSNWLVAFPEQFPPFVTLNLFYTMLIFMIRSRIDFYLFIKLIYIYIYININIVVKICDFEIKI
jgi:hypothetical protein